MTVRELIKDLERQNPDATVWISDQQGGGGQANSPYAVRKGLQYEFHSGEKPDIGDVVMSYENT